MFLIQRHLLCLFKCFKYRNCHFDTLLWLGLAGNRDHRFSCLLRFEFSFFVYGNHRFFTGAVGYFFTQSRWFYFHFKRECLSFFHPQRLHHWFRQRNTFYCLFRRMCCFWYNYCCRHDNKCHNRCQYTPQSITVIFHKIISFSFCLLYNIHK